MMEMGWKGISEIEQEVKEESRRKGIIQSTENACMGDYKYYLDNFGL